jgi:hypothetical protein
MATRPADANQSASSVDWSSHHFSANRTCMKAAAPRARRCLELRRQGDGLNNLGRRWGASHGHEDRRTVLIVAAGLWLRSAISRS